MNEKLKIDEIKFVRTKGIEIILWHCEGIFLRSVGVENNLRFFFLSLDKMCKSTSGVRLVRQIIPFVLKPAL